MSSFLNSKYHSLSKNIMKRGKGKSTTGKGVGVQTQITFANLRHTVDKFSQSKHTCVAKTQIQRLKSIRTRSLITTFLTSNTIGSHFIKKCINSLGWCGSVD